MSLIRPSLIESYHSHTSHHQQCYQQCAATNQGPGRDRRAQTTCGMRHYKPQQSHIYRIVLVSCSRAISREEPSLPLRVQSLRCPGRGSTTSESISHALQHGHDPSRGAHDLDACFVTVQSPAGTQHVCRVSCEHDALPVNCLSTTALPVHTGAHLGTWLVLYMNAAQIR